MLFAGSIDDLKVLSDALTQYVENECAISVEQRGGSSPEVVRPRWRRPTWR